MHVCVVVYRQKAAWQLQINRSVNYSSQFINYLGAHSSQVNSLTLHSEAIWGVMLSWVTVGHLRVTVGHFRATVGKLRVLNDT